MDPRYQATADALGMSLEDLLTAVSYETAGSLDPMKQGPTTQWGQHRGLIQFGEPQAAKYGVDFSSPDAALDSQLGEEGAIVQYMMDHGFKPGEHDFMDFYSTINAGAPGRYNASDANNGGAAGTVRDKVLTQMDDHRRNAQRYAGLPEGVYQPTARGERLASLDGPTRRRADAGLPLNTRDPKEEDRSGLLAGLLDKRDTMRAGFGDKLGLDEDQMGNVGKGLQGLGSFISRGGFA